MLYRKLNMRIEDQVMNALLPELEMAAVTLINKRIENWEIGKSGGGSGPGGS